MPDELRPSTTSLGLAGENRAVNFLKKRGYRIAERNLDTPRGEIDIIAWDAGTLCFIEVKARSRSDFGGGEAAVDARKQARLWKAAEAYLAGNEALWSDPPECRFDVVAVAKTLGIDGDQWTCELFQGAFGSSGDP